MKAIRNLINGNLADAKNSARHRTHKQIVEAAINKYGKTLGQAFDIADYLKGRISWDFYCRLSKDFEESHVKTFDGFHADFIEQERKLCEETDRDEVFRRE